MFRCAPCPFGRTSRATRGFSLLELLVVLAVIGLLIGLVAPSIARYLGRGRADVARVDIGNLESGLERFRLDLGRYPTEREGLAALFTRPAGLDRWQGPYLTQDRLPLDPWDQPYVYRIPGRHGTFDLYSRDGDGGAPIASW